MTEQKAIEGCRKQDRISQKYLFDRYSDGMLMLCMRYVQHLPDAEELMLNGFFNFFKTIDRFVCGGPGNTGAWLRKIMVNECLSFLRRKGRIKLADEGKAMEIPADDRVLAKMSADELYRVIATLPAGYRTVFNLFVVEGYGHKEIAELLGISEGTSKSQLNKARMLLQKVIKENSVL